MPFVIYIFALSAFALGLAEFVPIGLSAVVADSLQVDVGQAAQSVTLYALGATIAAPVLSALTARWSRRSTMLATMLVFSVGSSVAALAPSVHALLGARFLAGLGHGLFLAVASSTAARLAGTQKAGSAVALVFGGFTLAMAVGVPLGTYLGGLLSWRAMFGAIAVFGLMGCVGLWAGMRNMPEPGGCGAPASVGQAVAALLHPRLLSAALITVLGYGGSFTVYTYIAPLLAETTQVGAATVGWFMLSYGVLAALGNMFGGAVTDRLGANRASLAVIAGMAAVAAGMWAFATSPLAMGVLVGLLGMFTFAAVPALQARLMGIAERHAPQAHGVAAGLNIAGFNFGITLGASLGGATIAVAGVAYTGLAGAAMSVLGLLLLMFQTARERRAVYRTAAAGG